MTDPAGVEEKNGQVRSLSPARRHVAGNGLPAQIGGLAGDLIADPVPVRMIEDVGRFGQLAVMDAEGLTGNRRRAVEKK
jgi:hypothetical protein